MQLTTRTIKYPLREAEPPLGSQSMPTTTTRLTGISRVHSYETTPGPFCLDDQHTVKTSPRRVRDGLSQTMIVEHPVDFQILNRNQPEAVDYTTGMLVSEVASTPCRSLMHSRHDFTTLRSSGRTLLLFGECALRFGKCLFLRAEEAWVGNLLPCGESGERLQSNVYPHLLIGHGKLGGFPLTGEGGVPLIRTTPTYAYRLGGAFEGAVKHYLHRPHFGQVKRIANKFSSVAILRVADRIVSTVATKSGIAPPLPSLHPTEEGLKGQFYPLGNVLQYLAMHPFERRTSLLEERDTSLSLVPTGIAAFLFMSLFAVGKRVVVQPATFLKHLAHGSGLRFRWINSVQERLSHVTIMHYFRLWSNIHLRQSNRGLSDGLLRRCVCIPIAGAKQGGLPAMNTAKNRRRQGMLTLASSFAILIWSCWGRSALKTSCSS
jgi:hypothetical protein